MVFTFFFVIYQGVNITADMSPDILSITYTDNEDGQADDISIRIKDETKKWMGDWSPELGDKFSVKLMPLNQMELNCGLVEVDEISASGPPTVFDIKGCSVPIKSEIRRVLKNHSWEKITLNDIAKQMASNAGLELLYSVAENPYYERSDQNEESDLSFLHKLAEDEGYSVKVTDSQLVIFDQYDFEQKDPIGTYTAGDSLIKSFSFNKQSHDLYKSCTCRYHIPKHRKLIQYTYTDPDIDEGINLKIRKRVANVNEAKRKARAALRQKNKHQCTGSLSLVGNTALQAGATINIAGFGKYDGKYIITKSVHSHSTSGYTTGIDIRRVIKGY